MLIGVVKIQALIDKKKLIITKTSIRSDLHLEGAGGTDCLPTATIFEELAQMGYEKPSQKLTFNKAFLFCLHSVLDLEKAKDAQAKEIADLKKRVHRCKARGVVVQEPSEFRTPQESQPSITKDKGKAIMIEPEVPLKRKDQVALDEDLARNLQAQLEAEIIEEEKLAMKQEEEANMALIESWDNTQAMMEADFELAQRLQIEEQGEITIEEKSKTVCRAYEQKKETLCNA
ncbi:hypothetical protein Tco_1252986 [Tanacetum coccineum]